MNKAFRKEGLVIWRERLLLIAYCEIGTVFFDDGRTNSGNTGQIVDRFTLSILFAPRTAGLSTFFSHTLDPGHQCFLVGSIDVDRLSGIESTGKSKKGY